MISNITNINVIKPKDVNVMVNKVKSRWVMVMIDGGGFVVLLYLSPPAGT